MAWTNPKTWVANTILTAADLNTYLRDNLDQTAPAVATTAGRIITTDGANSVRQWDILNKYSNIADDTASTTGSWETWSATELTLATTTSHDVALWMALVGYVVADSGATDIRCDTRMQWSWDGGSTWNDGTAIRVEVNSSSLAYANVSHTALRAEQPTGDVMLRAQLQQGSGGSGGEVTWTNGRLMAFVLPT